MKLKLMLLAMCVCGGTSLLIGNGADPKEESAKTAEVADASKEKTAQAEAASNETKENCSPCKETH